MFRFILTVVIFALLARDVRPSSTTDAATATATLLQSSVHHTSAASRPGDTSQSTATGVTNSNNQAASSTAARHTQIAPVSSTASAKTAASATTGANAASATSTAASATSTAASATISTVASTAPAFHCYVGNCTGIDCHKNDSIYTTLTEAPCTSKHCAIKVTKNATWSLSAFSCAPEQCICQKKVPGQVEMCCSNPKCNDKNLQCSRSSRLVTSLVVVVIAVINLFLFN